MRVVRELLLTAVLCLAASNLASAAPGTTLAVDTGARAEGDTVRTLTVGSDLFIGDRVVTDKTGLVQIRFADDTLLAVGPNSALVLDDYLLRSDGSAGSLAVNFLSGAFRFITGKSSHDDYHLRTPTGTVAIRGTAFDLLIAGLTTRLLMYRGATSLCGRDDACVAINRVCQIGQSDDTKTETLGQAENKTGATRDVLRSNFPFARNQSQLLAELQLPLTPNCRLGATAPPAK